jgi:ketosteroid isomerase-like protein
MKNKLILTILFSFLTSQVHAENESPAAESAAASSSSPLFKEISAMDKTFFDAFNREDFEGVKVIFDRDLEFYHDTAGLKNYEQNLKDTSDLFKRKMKLKRELVPGTMEVHPVPNYGAIQTGEHTFCHMEAGKNDCGTFKFVHIWKKTGSNWNLTRVVSFDH